MTYELICPNCGNIEELNCKISEYEEMKKNANFPFCKCGIRMERHFTPISVTGEIGGYDAVGGKAQWQG